MPPGFYFQEPVRYCPCLHFMAEDNDKVYTCSYVYMPVCECSTHRTTLAGVPQENNSPSCCLFCDKAIGLEFSKWARLPS